MNPIHSINSVASIKSLTNQQPVKKLSFFKKFFNSIALFFSCSSLKRNKVSQDIQPIDRPSLKREKSFYEKTESVVRQASLLPVLAAQVSEDLIITTSEEVLESEVESEKITTPISKLPKILTPEEQEVEDLLLEYSEDRPDRIVSPLEKPIKVRRDQPLLHDITLVNPIGEKILFKEGVMKSQIQNELGFVINDNIIFTAEGNQKKQFYSIGRFFDYLNRSSGHSEPVEVKMDSIKRIELMQKMSFEMSPELIRFAVQHHNRMNALKTPGY